MDNGFWKDMRDLAYGLARRRGASHVHADDVAQKALMVLAAKMEQEVVNNPGGFIYRTVYFLMLGPRDGRPRWEDPLDDPTLIPGAEPGVIAEPGAGGVETYAVQWMFEAAALTQVLHFGELQERGHIVLLLASSDIDPSSVEMAFEYIERLVATAPADPHTRRNARDKFQRLLGRAKLRVKIDTETVITEGWREKGRGGWSEQDGDRHELSGNALDGVTLLRLLFPRMPEPVAVAHAVAVEKVTWEGRDRGASLWVFKAVDDPPEDEDVREVVDALKQLWKWKDGGELAVTMGVRDEVTIRISAGERHLLLEAPTGEQCFGQPLSSDAVEVLVEDLAFDPPDEEFNTYTIELAIKKKDHNEDVVDFVFETLETVYGWDPDHDTFSWQVEYYVPDEEDEAA